VYKGEVVLLNQGPHHKDVSCAYCESIVAWIPNFDTGRMIGQHHTPSILPWGKSPQYPLDKTGCGGKEKNNPL
jgi:hypothetical protein